MSKDIFQNRYHPAPHELDESTIKKDVIGLLGEIAKSTIPNTRPHLLAI